MVENKEQSQEKVISDQTEIAGTTWANLKEAAMKPDVREQTWFVSKLNHSLTYYLELD